MVIMIHNRYADLLTGGQRTREQLLVHQAQQEGLLLRRFDEASEEERQLRVAHLPRAHAQRIRRLAA